MTNRSLLLCQRKLKNVSPYPIVITSSLFGHFPHPIDITSRLFSPLPMLQYSYRLLVTRRGGAHVSHASVIRPLTKRPRKDGARGSRCHSCDSARGHAGFMLPNAPTVPRTWGGFPTTGHARKLGRLRCEGNRSNNHKKMRDDATMAYGSF